MTSLNNILIVIGKLSPTTKAFSVLILLFYVLSFFTNAQKLLAITPGYLLSPNLNLWTLITFIFFDDHFYCVIIDLVTVFFSSTLLEPLWGQVELFKFLFIVTISSGLSCFFLCYFIYIFTHSPSILFNTHIHGLIAYSAALTVAVHQTLPDEILTTLPVGTIKNQQLSFICLIIVSIMAMSHLVEFVYPFLFASGMIVSWIYLRFFQKHENGNYGDSSSTFEFARFFPKQLAPGVRLVCHWLESLLVRLRLRRRPERLVRATPLAGVVVRDPDESQRRKQMALKALNDRLQAGASSEPWPTLADNSGTAAAADAAAEAAAAAPPPPPSADRSVQPQHDSVSPSPPSPPPPSAPSTAAEVQQHQQADLAPQEAAR